MFTTSKAIVLRWTLKMYKMRNEDQLAKANKEFDELPEVEKTIISFEQGKGKVKKRLLSEKKIKEYLFDYIIDIELYPHEIEEYKEIDFDLDLEEIKIRFAGKIASYNIEETPYGDHYTYTVNGVAAIYDNKYNLISNITYEDEFEHEHIVDDEDYYNGHRELNF